ncbi:MAG: efflux RND transporter periplasmic adaptor subunit [Hyphomicrobiales bacterium]|nr:efflux RND transporter periplasmic adaptor subunit [Hyphomicrobiales bacterium]
MRRIGHKTRNSLIAIGLLIGAGGAAAVVAKGEGVGADPAKDPSLVGRPVLTTVVRFAPEQPSRTFMATIRPRIEADQGFRVAGKVAERLVQTGRVVKAGEALARLDDADLKLQKEQAEAELAASRMAMEQTSADEKRGAQLLAKGWTARAVHDRQRAAAEEARGRNRRAQRTVELAANALGYATLRADADGVVTATLIEPGQVVAAGQPAIRIARQNEKEAAVALSEAFVARARDGAASVTLWADPHKIYRATLRELSPAADPATRTFAARFSLPDADDRVALGMSATLTISAPGSANVARVPSSALFDQGKGPSLWVVGEDGVTTLKPVAVLRYEGADAVVTSGVADGVRIVTLGVQKLAAGEKVRPISQLAF